MILEKYEEALFEFLQKIFHQKVIKTKTQIR